MKTSLTFLVVLFAAATAFCHPGGTDKNGGHIDSKTGKYHVHAKTEPPKKTETPKKPAPPKKKK